MSDLKVLTLVTGGTVAIRAEKVESVATPEGKPGRFKVSVVRTTSGAEHIVYGDAGKTIARLGLKAWKRDDLNKEEVPA